MLEKEKFNQFGMNTELAHVEKKTEDLSGQKHFKSGIDMRPQVEKAHYDRKEKAKELAELETKQKELREKARGFYNDYFNQLGKTDKAKIAEAKEKYCNALGQYNDTKKRLIAKTHEYRLAELDQAELGKDTIDYAQENYRYNFQLDSYKDEYARLYNNDTAKTYTEESFDRKQRLLCQENTLIQHQFMGDKARTLVEHITKYNDPKLKAGMAIAELPQDALETMYLAFEAFMKRDMWESNWIIENIEVALKMIDLYEEVVKRSKKPAKGIQRVSDSQTEIDAANSFMEKYSFHVKTLLADYGINDIKKPTCSKNIDSNSQAINWIKDMKSYNQLYANDADIDEKLEYKNDKEKAQVEARIQNEKKTVFEYYNNLQKGIKNTQDKFLNKSNGRLLDLEYQAGLFDNPGEIEGLRDLSPEMFYKRNGFKMIDVKHNEQNRETIIQARQDMILNMAGYKNIERINRRIWVAYGNMQSRIARKGNKCSSSFTQIGPMLNEVYDFFKKNYNIDAQQFAEKEQLLHIKLQFRLRQALVNANSIQEKRYVAYLMECINTEEKGDLSGIDWDATVRTVEAREELLLQSAQRIANKDFPKKGYKVKNVDMRNVPLFLHEPNIKDVAQSGLGDCVFLGELAGLAMRDPQAIKNCMRDNGNGTVTVRLFANESNAHYVTVKKTAPVIYKGKEEVYITSRGALWVQMLEKAYACLYKKVCSNPIGVSDSNRCDYKNLGGTKGEITRMIYGRKTIAKEIDIKRRKLRRNSKAKTNNPQKQNKNGLYKEYNSYEESLYNKIIEGLKKGTSMSSAFYETVKKEGEDHWQLSNDHQYQIVGAETVDLEGVEKRFVCLFNPHGRNVIHYSFNADKVLKRTLVKRDSEYEKCTTGMFMMELRDFLSLCTGIERYTN